MEHGTRGVVTTEEIVHFNETSGTMGNPKGIPYTKRMAEILMGYSGAYTYYRSYVARARAWPAVVCSRLSKATTTR